MGTLDSIFWNLSWSYWAFDVAHGNGGATSSPPKQMGICHSQKSADIVNTWPKSGFVTSCPCDPGSILNTSRILRRLHKTMGHQTILSPMTWFSSTSQYVDEIAAVSRLFNQMEKSSFGRDLVIWNLVTGGLDHTCMRITRFQRFVNRRTGFAAL